MPKERMIKLPHGNVQVREGGAGPALVVLPHEIGFGGWTPFLDSLAATRRVLAVSPPGFEQSTRPDWLRNVPDLAALVGQALDRLVEGKVAILGLGFGGWVAAELAARSPARVASLLLHAPMGVKPPSGQIVDQFLVSTTLYGQLGFTSLENFHKLWPEQETAHLDGWDDNREMTTRIAWKPYMFNSALPHLLRAVAVPAMVSWGRDDRIVPRAAAAAYADAIPDAVFREFSPGGHLADFEFPEALASLFLTQLAEWNAPGAAPVPLKIVR